MKQKTKKQLQTENETLRKLITEIHWMARRYADNRQSYGVGSYNDSIRIALKLGVKLEPTQEKIIWARDQMGRKYDGLSDREATPGTPEAMGVKC